MKHEQIIRKNLLMRLLSFAFVALFLITVLPSFAEGRGHTLSGQRAIEWLVRNHYIDPYTHIPTKRFYDFHKALHTAPYPGPGGLGLIIAEGYEGWHPYQEPTNRPIRNVTIVVDDSRDAFNISGMWKAINYAPNGVNVCYDIEQGPHSNSFNWKIIHPDIPEEWVIVPITYYDYIFCLYHRPIGPDANDEWERISGTIEIPRRGNLAERIVWGRIIWERDYANYCNSNMVVKNVAGSWTAVNYSPNDTPAHYIINQVNDLISWTIQHPDIPQERTRNCKISGDRISCEFNRPVGPHSNGINGWTPINGTINESSNKISWDNGIVWLRY